MAGTVQARRLTEAHRLAQQRIGAGTVAAMLAVWPLLDAADLDATFDRWQIAAQTIVRAQRATSSRLAANYLATYKALEAGTAQLPLDLAEVAPPDAVATSLLVTGPVAVKASLAAGVTLAKAMDGARIRAAGAATRHVLNGGRDTITQTIDADPAAAGWARVTSGRPCAFCAMIASRGSVFSEATGSFESHDHCSCSAEPVYRTDNRLPPGSQRFADLYQQAKDDPGDTGKVFRQLVESA